VFLSLATLELLNSIKFSQNLGESGLDGTALLPSPAIPAVTSTPAIDAIATALLATPLHSSWLVATGTLTNIAQLFDKYPILVHHIKGLSIMGGAIGKSFTSAPLGRVGTVERFGNWTPYAGMLIPNILLNSICKLELRDVEFNIVVDPEAAQLIFSNFELAAKTILIPLDVTHQVLATKEVQSLLLHGRAEGGDNLEITGKPSTLRTMFVELLNFFGDTYAAVFGIREGPPLHDPLAVAAILDGIPEHEIPFYDHVIGQNGRKERYEVSVITGGTHEQALKGETATGRTIAKLLEKGEGGIKIPRSLNVQRFWAILEQCLKRADEQNGRDSAGDE